MAGKIFSSWQSVKRILLIVGVVIAILFAITFTLKNGQIVKLEYYFGWSWESSLAMLVFLVFLIGGLIGYLGGLLTPLFRRRDSDSTFR